MLLSLRASKDNTRGPRFMQEALAAIHQANRARSAVTLQYGSHDGRVGLYCRAPEEMSSLVANAITAKYPTCSLTVLEDEHALEPPPTERPVTWSTDVRLVPDLFPILRHSQFEDLSSRNFADPIDALLQSLQPDSLSQSRIDIRIVPATRSRRRSARRALTVLDSPLFRKSDRLTALYARAIASPIVRPFARLVGTPAKGFAVRSSGPQIDTSAGRHHEREDNIQAASDKLGGHLFDVQIRLLVYACKDCDVEAEQKLRQIIGAFGSFTVSRLATFRASRTRRNVATRRRSRGFLMSHEELATLWHPPTESVAVSHMQTTDFAELEAPSKLDAGENGGVTLGRVKFRGDRRPVVLGCEDRRRHLYIIGKTGMGKTTLLQNQITADIAAGRGVCLIDPHGDLADRVVASVPAERTSDIVLFDPSDDEFVIAYNPLACFDPDKRDLVADDVLSAFAKVYDLSQAPRLKDTLRNALYVLIEKEMTLLDLLRLLGDARFRREVVSSIDDEVARLFWEVEFQGWNDRYRTEALSAVQNKVRPFLMNKRIRAIVGQRRRPLSLRQIMDDGKVLIVNLSKGKIGEDNSALLGALLVSSLQQAAMSRADVPEIERRDFYLFVDEFQNFTTNSFATILSEARKYRLTLTVANQYLRQLDQSVSDAVFGNVGSMITFQVGSDDAEILSRQLAKYPGQLTARDLAGLPRFTAYVRLLIDGLPSNPFSMETLQPGARSDPNRYAAVRAASRRHYCQPMLKVRAQIQRELATE